MKISVLGDGGWGTTLAILLHKNGHKVTLWGAFPGYVTYLKQKRINARFLPDVPIPRSLNITSDLKQATTEKDLIVLAIPSQHMRSIIKLVKACGVSKAVPFLSATKGLEIRTLLRMSELIQQELGKVGLGVLSGPTIAREVAMGVPTTGVVASSSKMLRTLIAGALNTDRFRVYTNSDVIGVELGGSLKNVIAIACGISDGLGFGTNAKASLLTRGLAEMSRLGIKLGAKASTFSGISGLGDLVTTCVSPFSRNRYVGERIGKGKTARQVTDKMKMVAEGVPTTKATYNLSLKYNIDMPITQEIYKVLYKDKDPKKAVRDLMTRSLKEE